MSAMTPKKADTTVPETPRRRTGGPRESAARTRLSIIEASIQEFSQKGFEGARVDEIALRAGVNKNLLYHHFGNKDGLFVAVLTHTYENIRSRQQDIQLRTVDPERRGALIREAQGIVMRDVALIPLHYQANTWAVRSGLAMVGRSDERIEAALVRPG